MRSVRCRFMRPDGMISGPTWFDVVLPESPDSCMFLLPRFHHISACTRAPDTFASTCHLPAIFFRHISSCMCACAYISACKCACMYIHQCLHVRRHECLHVRTSALACAYRYLHLGSDFLGDPCGFGHLDSHVHLRVAR